MIKGPGLVLSERFFHTLVAPMLSEHFPALPYAAARIGLGSEVLGYDTPMSADHDYGPCVQIFLPAKAFPRTAKAIMEVLDQKLPASIDGWNVRYPTVVRPPANTAQDGMLGSDHGVELYTLQAWCDRFFGRQFASELTPIEWLSYPEHLFLSITAGAVFRDDLGELTALRTRLAYFPQDVWLYKLAVQWDRIAEERAYIGRTGDVGDELGSRVIASRMVSNIMRLALLIERRYAPYPKWFGTAFSRLACAGELSPKLEQVLAATTWQTREQKLIDACNFVAELQVKNAIPGAIHPTLGSIHSRPFRFINSLKIGNALRHAIGDEDIREFPEFGAVDQFISSGFVLAVPDYSESVFAALLAANI
jgi:hypothetical protein